jgi:PIN domain nuclease of toxin-antitoxin system
VTILLDTSAFLFAILGDPRLSSKAASHFRDPGNQLLLSMASLWEMAVKYSLGKLQMPKPIDRFISEELAYNRVEILDIKAHHVFKVAELPFHHRDPFDRIIAAQALTEELPLVTSDAIFRRYAVRIIT